MGLVTGITRRAEVPGEPGAWLQLRMLSWLQLDEARQKRLETLTGQMRMLAGVELPKSDAAAVIDPLASYDRGVLLEHGITAWSYGEPVTPATSGNLDERTAEWAAREILDLSIPSEATEKKGSSRYTGTSEATAG